MPVQRQNSEIATVQEAAAEEPEYPMRHVAYALWLKMMIISLYMMSS